MAEGGLVVSIRLRKLDCQRDIDALFEYWASPETQHLFMHQSSFSSRPEFERWLMRRLEGDFHDFFVIADSTTGEAAGFTYSYEFHPFDGHCKLTCCLFEDATGLGKGAAVGLKMADYLFRSYPLRQLYTAVFSYNEKSMRMHTKESHGWKEVGLFEGYRYLNGAYHDLHVFCMDRDVFYEKHSDVLSRLERKE